MLVKATNMSSKLRVGIKELGRIAMPGEEFEVSSIRYEILSGNNKYNAVFVIRVKEQKKDTKKEEDTQVTPKGKRQKKSEVVEEENESESEDR